MSQMLVRIDKKMNDALIEVAKAITIGEEDMLEDLKNCLTVRRLRFRRKKNSYIYPKVSFESQKILFIERLNKEEK